VLSQQLNDLGCVPAKSLILTFPKFILPNLLNHFVRGYSDGDGCIYQSKKNYIWQITSTNIFCNYLKQHIKNILDVNCCVSLSNSNFNKITSNLSVGGNLQSRKVLDWLYKDAKIYLPRKYDKYQKFIILN